MKTNKILKVMCTVIVIILLVLIAFVGIYVSQNGRMVNIVKDYNLGMELGGGRQIILSPISETKTVYENKDGKELISVDRLSEDELKEYTEKKVDTNPEEIMTADNFKAAKKVFKERLDRAGLAEYQISVNEENGNIVIMAAEDVLLDDVIYTIFAPGKLFIQDSETLETLISSEQIKDARVGYNTTQSGTAIFLTIELNKEGAEKLEQISEIYVKSKDDEGKETTKTVTLYIDGQTITTTFFGEKMTNGMLNLSIGSASTDGEQLRTYVKEATNLANVLGTSAVEVEYEMSENEYISSSISVKLAKTLLLLSVAAITAMIVYLVIEYKERGIIAGITFIGFIAGLLLAVKLSNTILTLESLGAIILSILFNYAFLNVVLAKLLNLKTSDSTPKAEINKTIKKALLILVPALVIAVVFCFVTFMAISSFGTALFWGVAIFVLYTFLVTKPLLLNFEYLFEE